MAGIDATLKTKVSFGQFSQAKLRTWTLKSDNIWVLVQALALTSDLGQVA